ncbi:MAG: ABC transporter ATP-binding protein [Promethearchaeota archaeon]
MLRIEDLSVSVDGHQILKDFNLTINRGEVHVLLGPNGVGKSTLIYTILGYPNYKVDHGKIYFKNEDITDLPINERVLRGIGVLFQHPPRIQGVKLKKLVNMCGERRIKRIELGYDKIERPLENECEDLDEQTDKLSNLMKIPRDFLERDVNVGFSGGEVKRSEILQILALKPEFMIFDEPDSGVDIENVELIGKVMRDLLQRDVPPIKQKKAGLIITHLGYILKYLGKIDRAHIMLNGRIVCNGDPDIVISSVMKYGFDECNICAVTNGDVSCNE